MTISRSFLLRKTFFQTNFAENIKTHILCSTSSYPENRDVYENAEKCGADRQATDGNIMWLRKDAICMPGN
jgi:hypothetical protein